MTKYKLYLVWYLIKMETSSLKRKHKAFIFFYLCMMSKATHSSLFSNVTHKSQAHINMSQHVTWANTLYRQQNAKTSYFTCLHTCTLQTSFLAFSPRKRIITRLVSVTRKSQKLYNYLILVFTNPKILRIQNYALCFLYPRNSKRPRLCK